MRLSPSRTIHSQVTVLTNRLPTRPRGNLPLRSFSKLPDPSTPMASSPTPLLLLIMLLLSSPSPSASLFLLFPFSNTSISISTTSSSSSPTPNLTFLDEVIEAVSEKYRWDTDAEVRVWPLDADAARVGAVQRYEFRAHAGSAAAVVRLADDAVEWRRPAAPAVVEVDGPDGLDVAAGTGTVGFGSGVRDVELVGPVEVVVAGGEDSGRIEVQLPSRNATYTGLKRVLVAAGIAIKVIGAQKVFLTHPHDIGLLANGSLVANDNDPSRIWPLSYATCAPLLRVSVVGSILLVSHKTNMAGGCAKTLLRSHDTVELLSDKCHVNMSNRLISACLFCSVSHRLMMLEKLLKTWFSKRNQENRSIHFVEAKVTSITLVKFRLELERDITEEDGIRGKVSDFKTKPKVQRVILDIVARVEEEGRLKIVSLKRVRKPFPRVDATSWSSLTSNISFTKFLSFVVPPEASLDVKW